METLVFTCLGTASILRKHCIPNFACSLAINYNQRHKHLEIYQPVGDESIGVTYFELNYTRYFCHIEMTN